MEMGSMESIWYALTFGSLILGSTFLTFAYGKETNQKFLFIARSLFVLSWFFWMAALIPRLLNSL